jgi:hypothetical protein
MIKDSGAAFYANDTRFMRASLDGFTQSNTDKGVLYYNLVISGGTATLTFYKWNTDDSGDAVASGSATVEANTMTLITLTESNGSGLVSPTGGIALDLRSDTSNIMDGKMIASFSFDDDFKLYEKTIDDWSSSNQWEGKGTAGCAFVRVHRAATVWCIERLRNRIKGMVDWDGKDLPDLFDIDLSLEDMRDAAVQYGLYLLYFNQKNAPMDDPHLERAERYLQRAESRMASTRIHLDFNSDGKVDQTTTSWVTQWE